MNEDRRALADLLARLYGMGVESADLPDHYRDYYLMTGDGLTQSDVLLVLSEMMNLPTPGITMGDVLTAAKRAGVY